MHSPACNASPYWFTNHTFVVFHNHRDPSSHLVLSFFFQSSMRLFRRVTDFTLDWGNFTVVWTENIWCIFKVTKPKAESTLWQRDFISTVRPTVHTSLSRMEVLETVFKPKEVDKVADFSFSCDRKHFENRAKNFISVPLKLKLDLFVTWKCLRYCEDKK